MIPFSNKNKSDTSFYIIFKLTITSHQKEHKLILHYWMKNKYGASFQ